jgi:hypothetical protein
LSPGGVKRQAAQDELDDLYVEFMAHEEVGAEAERSLALAERIYEAKERRLDAAQKKRKRNGSPFGELERIYKMEIELLQAKLLAAEAEATTHNAEANWLAQGCRVLRLENAKLTRTVRKLGGHSAKARK